LRARGRGAAISALERDLVVRKFGEPQRTVDLRRQERSREAMAIISSGTQIMDDLRALWRADGGCN